jgi:hypothetical protein
MEGGFVSVTGGSVVNAESTTGATLFINPASSVTYANPYPLLRIGSAHIESASPLAIIANPRALTTPTSTTSSLSIVNAGGYVPAAIAAQDFITNSDTSYAGYIDIKQCNFYSDGARTAYNISTASALTRISCDMASFNQNFKHWRDGVSGGKLLHSEELLVSAYGVNATTTAGEYLIKFLNNGESGLRYGPYYNPATGLFTVPAAGMKKLNVKATLVGVTVAGDIYVKLNGVVARYGKSSGICDIDATLNNLVAGDTIGVYVSSASPVNYDNGVYQRLTISGSTL